VTALITHSTVSSRTATTRTRRAIENIGPTCSVRTPARELTNSSMWCPGSKQD